MFHETIKVNKKTLLVNIYYDDLDVAIGQKANSICVDRNVKLTRYTDRNIIVDKKRLILNSTATEEVSDGILFFEMEEDEYYYFSSLHLMKKENRYIKYVELDGKIIHKCTEENTVEDKILLKIDYLIRMFDKLKFQHNTQIKETLLHIKAMYVQTGRIKKDDIQWMNKIYSEHSI